MGFPFGRAVLRTVAWNVAAVTVTAFFASAAMFGDPAFVLLGTGFGALLGVGAGVVHAVAELPLMRDAGTRLVIGVVAAIVSAVLGVGFLSAATTEKVWPMSLVFAPYVLVSPFLAARVYDDASTAAAESAARRNGASSASRVDGSASTSSRATSE